MGEIEKALMMGTALIALTALVVGMVLGALIF